MQYRINKILSLIVAALMLLQAPCSAVGITLAAGVTIRTNNASNLSVTGDLDLTGTYTASTGTITMKGGISGNFNPGSNSLNNFTINRTDGNTANDNVTIITNNLTVTGTTTITDGELVQGTTNLTLAGMTVGAAGAYTNESTGNLVLSGNVANAGAITMDASGGGGGDNDDIMIRSSVLNTPRDWAGAGTFAMTDVNVRDQTANSGTPAFVLVTSGTNVANNNNWIFGGASLSSVDVEPASLVAGAEGDVTVTFVTTGVFPKDGKVEIDFGSGFNAAGLANITNSAGADGTWAVVLSDGDGTNDVVTLTRQNDGTQLAGGTTVTLILEDEVKNPVVTGSTGTYAVETQTSAAATIDTGTAAADTIIAGALSAVTIVPEALWVGALVDNTITFTTENAIPADGKIVIVYPEGFDLTDATTASSAADLDGTLTVALSGNRATITRAGGSVFGAGGTVDDLILNNVRNPKSPGTTGTFAISTTTSADVTIDSGTGAGVTIEANEILIKVEVVAYPTEVRIGDLITFEATITNMSNATLQDFNYVHRLPPGVIMRTGSAKIDQGTFASASHDTVAKFFEFSAIPAMEARVIMYQATVGSNAGSGKFTSDIFCQINPVISNTAQIDIVIIPDPVFEVGTLIGKVYWDQNINGYQDQGEPGVPNAVLATEEGFVITTDSHGRYHVKDFITGRHKIKLDKHSLPAGSSLTTPESRIINQTDAMLNKANFGVNLPESYQTTLGVEVSEHAEIILTEDPENPVKRLELQFHEITVEEDTKLLSQCAPGAYKIGAAKWGAAPDLPLRLFSNYPYYIEEWKFEVLALAETADSDPSEDPAERFAEIRDELRVVAELDQPGALPQEVFLYNWTHPFAYADGTPIEYFLRVSVRDENGAEDQVVYRLWIESDTDADVWRIAQVSRRENLPVRGTTVRMEGKTYPLKRVALFDQEALTNEKGEFKFETILPEGEYALPVNIYPDVDADPVTVIRHVRLRDTYVFFVGFSEYEWGQLHLNGNLQQSTAMDRAQYQENWYDEGRMAYYLKGKIKGKYLITASVDSRRGKKELFRDLEPEDYYAVYGDGSTVTKDADDTQDNYYVHLQADKSEIKYGNFNTDLTGTEFLDFERSLHGGRAHIRSLSEEADGKPTQVVTLFWAKSRQKASHNEFRATGGSLYYLKHRDLIQGSEKIIVQQRDKITGIAEKENVLVRGEDYQIDYNEGRIRLYRPITTFTFEENSFASTMLLDGDIHYMLVDYEYEPGTVVEDVTSGVRYSRSFMNNALRLGFTHIEEERPLERYELTGFDGNIELPFNTFADIEAGISQLAAIEQYISSDGGMNFNEVMAESEDVAGEAIKIDIHSRPFPSVESKAYYRYLDRDFSSTNSLSQTGTEKFGAQTIKDLGALGEVHVRYDREQHLDGGNKASEENAGEDTKTYMAQYFISRDAWDGLMEYRFTETTGSEEELVTGELEFRAGKNTTLSIGGQMSVREKNNNRITAKAKQSIGGNMDLVVTQSFGSRGMGTLLGIETDVLGNRYTYSKVIGSRYGQDNINNIPTMPSVMESAKQKAQETEVGLKKQVSKDTSVTVSGSMSGKRTLKLQRSTEDGVTMELVQQENSDEILRGYSKTAEVRPGVIEYSQDSTRSDKATGESSLTRTRGFKAQFYEDKGSLYSEESYTAAENGQANRGQTTGFQYHPDDKLFMDFSYQRNQTQTEDEDKDSHVGYLRTRYMDYGKMELENAWELKMDDDASNMLQVFSDGTLSAFLTQDLTLLGRYEWSWTKDKTYGMDMMRFTEFQIGLAYRPVWNDRINFLADYRYLTDEYPAGQISDLEQQTANERFVYQAEIILDINKHMSWVEKFGLREEEVRVLEGDEERSKTFLHAHRLNLWLLQGLGVGAEYRVLSQTLSDDITQGALVEGMARISDSFSVAVGYNFTEFNSDVSKDLNLEKEGFYFRFFYDPLEDVEALLEREAAVMPVKDVASAKVIVKGPMQSGVVTSGPVKPIEKAKPAPPAPAKKKKSPKKVVATEAKPAVLNFAPANTAAANEIKAPVVKMKPAEPKKKETVKPAAKKNEAPKVISKKVEPAAAKAPATNFAAAKPAPSRPAEPRKVAAVSEKEQTVDEILAEAQAVLGEEHTIGEPLPDMSDNVRRVAATKGS